MLTTQNPKEYDAFLCLDCNRQKKNGADVTGPNGDALLIVGCTGDRQMCI